MPLVNISCSKDSGKVNLAASSNDIEDYEYKETDPLPTVREEINLCEIATANV